MNRYILAGLGIYAAGLTFLVIKSQLEIHWLAEALSDVVDLLEQQQYDKAFAVLVEDLDDPDE